MGETNVNKEHFARGFELDTNPETAPEEVTIRLAIQSNGAGDFNNLARAYETQQIFSITKRARLLLVRWGLGLGIRWFYFVGLGVPFIIRREVKREGEGQGGGRFRKMEAFGGCVCSWDDEG
jgi:hypothetical protein